MDNIETLSDCSESSKNSECSSSKLSTFSGLSEYQGEFLELRQLINPETSLIEPAKNNTATTNIVSWYEKQINDLNVRLQQSLQQNEKYKYDMYNLQKKHHISYGEKIEKLLKQNQKLEANLSAANNQIQRLISIHNKKGNDEETSLLGERILQLEESNHQLINQNYLLSTKVNQCNFQKDEFENEYKNLKSEINELKLELSAKISSVNELKKQISDQHVQIQELSQNNVKLSHSLEVVNNELQFAKKSEAWYKNEMRQFQQEKSGLCEQVLENEKIIAVQEEKIEALKMELSNLKCSKEEIHLAALKEKERMLSQLELVEHTVQNGYNTIGSRDISRSVESITKYYDSVVNELTNEVAKIKSDFEYQQKCYEKVCKEKSDLAGKYIYMQNCLKDRDNTVEKLESNIKDLKEKLASAIDMQTKQNSEILGLKKTCVSLKNELDLKNEEKETFERSIATVKEQFKIFLNKHAILKNELHTKNKEILQLQYEKEELCVNNNQNVSELKELLERDVTEIEKLKQELQHLEILNKSMETEHFKNKEETIEHSNSLITIQSAFNEQVNPSSHHEDYTTKNEYLETHIEETKHLNLLDVTLESPNKNADSNALDTAYTLDVLKYICQMCKLNDNDNINSDSDYDFMETKSSDKDFIYLLVNKICSHLQFVETEIASKNKNIVECKKKLKTLKKNVLARIATLMDRCKLLEVRNEENKEMLEALCNEKDKNCNSRDEVQNLRTQLQVKIQEAKDKQKRYERNYRTLLRKVKEHMKGRNTAEKHSAYLQDLYDTLSEDCNTLRLQLDLKNSNEKHLQIRLENSLNINEKLKCTLRKLEQKLAETTPCTKCGEFETLKKRELELEQLLKNHENHKMTNSIDSKLKEDLIQNLQKENQRLLSEISFKNAETRDYTATIEKCSQDNKVLSTKLLDFEIKLTQEKLSNEQKTKELTDAKNSAVKLLSDNDQLMEKNEFLVQEIKRLSSCLQRKSEEVNELHLRKQHHMNRWQEKEENTQNLISDLKNQLYVFRSEVDVMKNEKFFLQRLCNDLKLALKSQINRNKALKDFLEKICRDREDVDRPTILSNFPSPVKYDDVYIDKLLQENKVPVHDKPFCDIQECLNKLRKEILFLQKQIAEKNVS